MAIYQKTTPTLYFTLPFPVNKINILHIVFKQNTEVKLTKLKEHCDFDEEVPYILKLKLSQQETSLFEIDPDDPDSSVVDVQIHCKLYPQAGQMQGEALTSDIIRFNVMECFDPYEV